MSLPVSVNHLFVAREDHQREPRAAVPRDRGRGLSLTNIAQAHRISRASVSRIIKEAGEVA